MPVFSRIISILSVTLLVLAGCQVNVPKTAKLSEIENLYDQGQYQTAMDLARYNLSKDPNDPATVVTIWKIQVINGTKSIDYTQQFFLQAQDKIKNFGEPLIPYLGRALLEDPYNTVRLFCFYALAEFQDTSSTQFMAKIMDPGYTLGTKPSNVTLEFMRSEAAYTLAYRKYGPAYEGIVALTKSEDGEVRAKAARALGLLGDARALPILENMRKDSFLVGKVRWVAEMADSAIAQIKSKQ